MSGEFYRRVRVSRLAPQKWEVEMENGPVRAYGTSEKDAYWRFLAVFELYKEYGENWMAEILSERSEEFVDDHMRRSGPWLPDSHR